MKRTPAPPYETTPGAIEWSAHSRFGLWLREYRARRASRPAADIPATQSPGGESDQQRTKPLAQRGRRGV